MTGNQITIKTFGLREIDAMKSYLSSGEASGKEILSIQCAGSMWVIIHKNA